MGKAIDLTDHHGNTYHLSKDDALGYLPRPVASGKKRWHSRCIHLCANDQIKYDVLTFPGAPADELAQMVELAIGQRTDFVATPHYQWQCLRGTAQPTVAVKYITPVVGQVFAEGALVSVRHGGLIVSKGEWLLADFLAQMGDGWAMAVVDDGGRWTVLTLWQGHVLAARSYRHQPTGHELYGELDQFAGQIQRPAQELVLAQIVWVTTAGADLSDDVGLEGIPLVRLSRDADGPAPISVRGLAHLQATAISAGRAAAVPGWDRLPKAYRKAALLGIGVPLLLLLLTSTALFVAQWHQARQTPLVLPDARMVSEEAAPQTWPSFGEEAALLQADLPPGFFLHEVVLDGRSSTISGQAQDLATVASYLAQLSEAFPQADVALTMMQATVGSGDQFDFMITLVRGD